MAWGGGVSVASEGEILTLEKLDDNFLSWADLKSILVKLKYLLHANYPHFIFFSLKLEKDIKAFILSPGYFQPEHEQAVGTDAKPNTL